MFKVLSRRLQHCNEVAASISKASPVQLQQIKTQLAAFFLRLSIKCCYSLCIIEPGAS